MIPGRDLNTPLQAWSWSALDSFETCPRRHYEIKVAKNIKEKPSEQMNYGKDVHKALEKRVKNKTPLPEALSKLEQKVSNLESLGGILLAEEQLAVNDKLGLTSWFGKDVWIRAMLDAQVHLGDKMILIDWKTGKMKDDWGQLTMAAHLKFVLHPELDEIGLMFIWTKYNDRTKKVVTREEAGLIWANEILPRVKKFQRAYDTNSFPPKPSGLCRHHCPVRSCEHNG